MHMRQPGGCRITSGRPNEEGGCAGRGDHIQLWVGGFSVDLDQSWTGNVPGGPWWRQYPLLLKLGEAHVGAGSHLPPVGGGSLLLLALQVFRYQPCAQGTMHLLKRFLGLIAVLPGD